MVLYAALILLAPFFAAAQTAATNLPEFEAASVKPVPLGTPYGGMMGGPGSSSSGQIHYDATLSSQVAGPRWIEQDRICKHRCDQSNRQRGREHCGEGIREETAPTVWYMF